MFSMKKYVEKETAFRITISISERRERILQNFFSVRRNILPCSDSFLKSSFQTASSKFLKPFMALNKQHSIKIEMCINVILSISEIYFLTVLVNFEITFPLKNDQAAPTVLFFEPSRRLSAIILCNSVIALEDFHRKL